MSSKSLIILFFFLLAVFAFNLLTIGHPPVWPDEAEYADVAYNIVNTGKPISTLHRGLYQTDRWIYGYPPILFLIASFAFKLFGFSLQVLRTTSIGTGILAMFLFYLISCKFHKKGFFVLLPVFLLAIDMTYLRTARVARPEIYVMMFSLASYFAILYINSDKKLLTAGIFSILAVLTHIMGLVTVAVLGLYIVIKYRKKALKKLLYLIIPLFAGLIVWIYLSGLSLLKFIESLTIALSRKNFEPTYLDQLFMGGDVIYTFLYVILFAGSIYTLIYLLLNKVKYREFLIITLATSWTAVIFARSFWYFAYPIPFLYLGYSTILKNELNKKIENNFQLIFISMLIFLTIVSNLGMNNSIITFTQTHSYDRFSKSVNKYIPDNSSVFISSIPDPYFILKKNPTLTLRQFPGLPGSKEAYINTLKQTDYVVFTQKLDYGFGNIFTDYLKTHAQKTHIIDNRKDGYKAIVIKLKH